MLNEWMKMGEPEQLQLVELGPGSGALVSDILRTFARLRPEVVAGGGLSVHLVEVSPSMRRLQRETLGCGGEAAPCCQGSLPADCRGSGAPGTLGPGAAPPPGPAAARPAKR